VPTERTQTLLYTSNRTTNFIPLFWHSYMFRANDGHHRATDTKPQSKVKYNTVVFTLWDPMSSRYKLYEIVKISK
jgi:hypothetical protein